MGKKALITGTLILTLANFITRILGFIFRVYMSNVMGAEGMGLYQLLFPIYMLMWAASSAGIALSVSKMVAAYTSKNQHGNALKVLKTSIIISLVVSTTLSILLYTGAPMIATYFIHEPNTTLALKIMSSCIPFMSVACCIRGYFQGRQEMSISALAQIVEQVARMLVIYLFAGFFIPKGIEYVCALGVLGMCGGEVFSFLLSYTVFKLKQRKILVNKATVSYHTTFQTLLTLSIPITANRFLSSTLQSLENILIPLQLQKFGLHASSALAVYGKLSGMALPLLFFPSMVTSSLSVVLVPTISQALAMNKHKLLQKTIAKAIQFSTLIGIGASALFLTFSKEIAVACYKLEDVGLLLKYLAIICPFLYLQNILTGTMNGLGMQKQTFKTNILGSLVCISIILAAVPTKGIIGFILALLIQSGLVTILLLSHVLKHITLSVDLPNWIVKPSIAAIASSFFSRYIASNYLFLSFGSRISILLSVLLLGLFYICLLFILGCVTKTDIQMFMHGK